MNPFEPKIRAKIIQLYFDEMIYPENIAERFGASLSFINRVIYLERKKRNACENKHESKLPRMGDESSFAGV